MRTSLRRAAIATAAAAALTLTGCTASGDAGESGTVNLNYWAWAPNLEQVVDIWNEQNPDIQVTVNKQDGGDPAITKLLTAIKAGILKGPIDLAQLLDRRFIPKDIEPAKIVAPPPT